LNHSLLCIGFTFDFNMAALHIFGIRHHGPGSAKSLKQALTQLQPDCLLIEAPQDAESLLSYVTDAKMKPPVAMLLYNPKLLSQAVYVPFTQFSPEWIAIQFALKNSIPIRFMDLPMSLQFGIPEASPTLLSSSTEEEQFIIKDPLAYLAKLSGYQDSERWWEVLFESQDNEVDIFDAILEMISTLRTQLNRAEDMETLRREAYMRKTARQVVEEGFQKIAIVCGAWHSPVFAQLDQYPAKKDNALLKGIKKVKTAATWIPWTYERIAIQSGYRAGVLAPAWYELLFLRKEIASTSWMVRVARLMRQHNLEASAAHALEAVRLAETLATMRGLVLPGIQELTEAALTCIAQGETTRLNLVQTELITGNKVGQVPNNVPNVPLQKDFEERVKTARLNKYLQSTKAEWLKATATQPKGGIDLREESDLLKSQLLHQLRILNVAWGTLQSANLNDKGSFKEYWKLHWKPDYYIKIIEASAFGRTVKEAATNALLQSLRDNNNLAQVIPLLEQTLQAHLEDVLPVLLAKLQALASLTHEVFTLMDALSPTVRMLRYGNIRQIELAFLTQLVDHLVPRICLGLPSACFSISEEVALEVIQKMKTVNDDLHVLQQEEYLTIWYKTLNDVVQLPAVHPAIQGACIRWLFDRNQWSNESVARQMRFVCSPSNPPTHAAQWLETFLAGSGLVLIHHQMLWQILDHWVAKTSSEELINILPILRRTFAHFSSSERQKMLILAKGQTDEKKRQWNIPQNSQAVIHTVGTLLGWESAS
jgi:hypothetical protein